MVMIVNKEDSCNTKKLYVSTTVFIITQGSMRKMGLEIQDTTIYSMLFADDQLLIAQDYEDLEYMTRKLIDEYEL